MPNFVSLALVIAEICEVKQTEKVYIAFIRQCSARNEREVGQKIYRNCVENGKLERKLASQQFWAKQLYNLRAVRACVWVSALSVSMSVSACASSECVRCVCLCWCCDRDSPVLFTMPSTGCCSLRLDYCRAEPTFGAVERELRDVSHFPHKPQSGLRTVDWGVGDTHPWPSGRTFLASQALEKTNHNSTSTSAYFLFGRRLSFVTPHPPSSSLWLPLLWFGSLGFVLALGLNLWQDLVAARHIFWHFLFRLGVAMPMRGI